MKDPLYQVHVVEKGVPKAVGPKMIRRAAEQFRDVIEAQIRKGKETMWSDPVVVACA